MDHVLSPIMEDYIETIFELLRREQVARVSDIATRMKVTMATVTSALRKLSAKKLINYSPYSTVSLTPAGKNLAEKIVRRHEVLADFFQNVLSLPPSKVAENACRMEHQIDDLLLERLVEYIEFVKLCPNMNIKWNEKNGFRCGQDENPKKFISCEDCSKSLARNTTHGGQQMNDSIGLHELKAGGRGRIIAVSLKNPGAKRMMEMGIVRGSLVEVERIAPLGDPIDIKVKGYHLSLRKEEAKNIFIEIM